MQKTQSLDDYYENDFGFSAVSEDDLKQLERKLQEEVKRKELELKTTSTEYKDSQQKLEALHKLIMPLLVNLQKDDGKSYIFWPNRSQKVGELIVKIEKLMDR